MHEKPIGVIPVFFSSECLASIVSNLSIIHSSFVSIHHSTFTVIPSECELNSGAYMHCRVVIPLENTPR